jgi:DNA modification methylase
MTPEQKQELIRLLETDEEISPEWARLLFPPEKREYELVYYGKEREEDIIADTLAVPLQPVRTFGKNGDDWHNMLIFGDNLQVIKTLLDMKRDGKLCNSDGTPGARLIYIDPPFATKHDFRGTEDQKAYQDKVAGADFLEFLRRRLVLMRELMADDGYLFVHLDMKRCHYIKVLLDEVMGEKTFLNHVIWSYRRWPSNCKNYQPMHDDILLYAKSTNSSARFFQTNYEDPSESYLKRFQGKTQVLDEETGTRKITVDAPTKGMPLRDVWDISIIAGFKGERTGYPTQKPEELLARILETCSRKGDLIVDTFAGSGTAPAVAEKLGRRWIAIDCGKFAIYTIQKRLLNLLTDIGHYGSSLVPKPFTLYNAGLYDFSKLKELVWQDWRFFALQLFQCREEPHRINGINFDGYRQGASVLIFNHMEAKHKNARVTEETIQEIHEAVGSRVGSKVFVIAPALTFDFQQDYIDFDKVRYYALRIPYSIIHELHRREFAALKQPSDEMAVNDTVEAVGFDFIRTPELKYKVGIEKPKGDSFEYGFIKLETFKSDAIVREPFKKKSNLETLSMVMLDFDYNDETRIFDLDEVHYADSIQQQGWKVRFRTDQLGTRIMAVFLDIYGNEARVLIHAKAFGGGTATKGAKKTKRKKK